MKWIVAAVLALACVLAPQRVRAAMMHHYDLTSLAFSADFIVRAREVSAEKKNEWTTVRTMEVVRSYKGGLAVGSTFRVDYDLYAMTPFGEWGDAPTDAGPRHVLGKELVLYLQRPREKQNVPPGDYWLVTSGLRIFLDGKAQRFVQLNNPGGFSPVPQGRDPYDLYDDPRAKDALDLAGLESEIFRTMRRADEAKAALAAPDSPAARRALIAWAGPDKDGALVTTNNDGFYADAVGQAIIEELSKRHDVKSTLEAFVRSSGVSPFRVQNRLPITEVLGVATDPKQSSTLRVAAIQWAAHGAVFALRELKGAEATTIALWRDPNPEIRRAALELQPNEKPSTTLKAALLDRWKVETDIAVRIAIVSAARSYALLGELGTITSTLPLLDAHRTGDVVVIRWADIDELFNLTVAGAKVVAHRTGEPDRTLDLRDHASSYTNGREGFLVGRLVFDTPLPPADAKVDVSVVLEDINKRRPTLRKSFDLGTMTPLPPLPPLEPAPGVSAPATVAPPPSASAVAPRSPAAPERKRSSCGCEVASRDANREALWPGLLLAALLARRSRAARYHRAALVD